MIRLDGGFLRLSLRTGSARHDVVAEARGRPPPPNQKNANNCCIMQVSVNNCLPFLAKIRFLRFSFVDLAVLRPKVSDMY